jgi:D-glycero-beta-D-manno-heptose-7-phosphate kinase
MSDVDGIRGKPLPAKEAGQSGDAGIFKDRVEGKQNKLSLAEIMAGHDKLASGLRKDSDKTSLSTFAALFGLGLIRELDRAINPNRTQEFRWMAAQSNVRELAQLFGRKFLQPGKGEAKKEKSAEDEERELETRTKHHLDNSKKVDDSQLLEEKLREDSPEKEDPRLKDKEQEEEIAIDLEFEKIYHEKDYLEELKRATELALGQDDAHTQGKTVFKELEKIQPQDMSAGSSTALVAALSRKRLKECIKNLSGGKVIVIGDLLIDELLEGKPERISREAPVLILEHVETELIPGGAANTAHNITSLGGACHAIGVCGQDEYATKLASLLDKHGITHGLVQDPSRTTTVKTRILSRSYAIRQQLLRLDRISHATIDSTVQTLIAERLDRAAAGYKAIILSDYRGGVISDGIIAACKKAANRHGLLYVVDAQDGFERFQGAALLTPNQPDAEKAVGYSFDTPEKLKRGGQDLLVLTGAQAVLITRGPDGMVLFRPGQPPYHMPVFNRSDVFDVTGAGDTVVATLTLALVTGSTLEESIALGNLAAGIVVRKPGTAVTNQEELINNLTMVTLAE